MNAESPRLPAAFSVRAKIRYTPACWPFVTQFLLPFRTYVSPCRTAIDAIAAASEPAPGSESENAASSRETRRGRKRRRWASVPKRNTGSAPTELCTAIMIASAAETRAISSSTTTMVRES